MSQLLQPVAGLAVASTLAFAVALSPGFTNLMAAESNQESAEQLVEMNSLPKAARKTIKRESFGGRIIEIEKESYDGKSCFEAEVVIDEHIYDVVVDETGLLLAKVMDRPLSEVDGEEDDGDEDGDDDGDDDDEGEDVAMTLDQLPRKKVRTTLERETTGGQIEDLERETENGNVIYSADVEYETERGDLEYEIEIAENGILLHKILESIESDDREDEDEDEDEEDEDEDEDDDE